MKMYLVHTLLSLATFLSLAACKKDDPESSLPTATQVGANTGGCLINGEPFVATGKSGTILSSSTPALRGGFDQQDNFSVVLSGRTSRGYTDIILTVKCITPGTYPLMEQSQAYSTGNAYCSFSTDAYFTTKKEAGRITITKLNKASNSAAGTFDFTARSYQDSTRTITVTAGRFDWQQ